MAAPSILVVEDNDLLRDAMVDMLVDEKFVVHAAANGMEALEKLSQVKVDLVLSDIRMPRMDGRQLLQAMQNAGIQVPVVLITAFSDITTQEAYHLGAVSLLLKPSPEEATIAAIREALSFQSEPWQILDELNPEHSHLTLHLKDEAPNLAHHIGVGRGGFFLPLVANFPHAFEVVSFELRRDQMSFQGVGQVLWTRRQAQGDLPPGVGIRLIALSRSSDAMMRSTLKALQPSAFVPLTVSTAEGRGALSHS